MTPLKTQWASRVLAVLVAIAGFLMTVAWADVTVTPGTGALNISSDTAADGTSPAWTTLSVITIAEGKNNPGRNDLGIGTGVTLVIKSPAGFEFNRAQTPGITFTPDLDIAAASVAVTDSTTLVITLTVTATRANDTFNLIDVQVRPTSASPLATARNLYHPNAGGGTAVVRGLAGSSNGSSGTSFAALSQSEGTFTQLQVLSPGETSAPGTPTGRSGTPSARTAGVPFNVLVNAVDAYWNPLTSTHVVDIQSSDNTAILPADAALVAGKRSFAVTLRTVSVNSSITASDLTDTTISDGTSSALTVKPGSFARLLLLAPGEFSAPGTVNGKSGTPSTQSSGIGFGMTLNATDANWNLLTNVSIPVGVSSSDASSSLPANTSLVGGTWNFLVTLRSARLTRITATDRSHDSQIPDATSDIAVSENRTVTGTVFNDTGSSNGIANDGVKNGGEVGLIGVVVRLFDGSGTLLASDTTDGTGAYLLNVPASSPPGGALRVTEINPSSHRSTGATVGNTGGAYTLAADSVAFTASGCAAYQGINFGDVPMNQLTPAPPQNAAAGTVAFYTHTFTAGTSGQVSFSAVKLSSPTNSGWNNTLFRDMDCNGRIATTDPAITGPLTLAAGEQVCVIVKEFIPVNAPFNAQDQITLLARFTYSGANTLGSTTDSQIDLTTVGTPTTLGLTLAKTVDKASAFPEDTITYTITYLNNSPSPIAAVSLFDSTPAFTSFLAATASQAPAPLSLGAIAKPAIGGKGPIRWSFSGSLNPGQSGTVAFSVIIE